MREKVINHACFLIALKILIPAFKFYHKFGKPPGLSREQHSCFTQKRQTSNGKNIDISIFLGYYSQVKYSCDFVLVTIFNLKFFVRVFSKTLFVDCAVYSQTVMFSLLGILRMDFPCSKSTHMKFFYQPNPCPTDIKDKFLASSISYRHDAFKAVQE